MKSIRQPISFSIPKKQTKFIDNYLPWLASLSAHVLIFLGLVLSTIHIKTQELPSRVIEATYFVVIEQKSQVETPATISSRIQEDRDRLDATKASDPTKKTLSVGEVHMARNSISEVTILLNDEFQKPTSQAGGGLAEISAKNSSIISPIFAQPLVGEKTVLPTPHPLRVNNGKAENLRAIEERGVRPDSKQLVDMRIFSEEIKNFSQFTSRKNKTISHTEGFNARCIFRPSMPQVPLPNNNSIDHFDKWGSNEAIRISDLVGHGRYVQPSTSVRVSDLLNSALHSLPMRRSNGRVNVSDVLWQH